MRAVSKDSPRPNRDSKEKKHRSTGNKETKSLNSIQSFSFKGHSLFLLCYKTLFGLFVVLEIGSHADQTEHT